MARSPTLADVVRSAMDCRMANLHTALPARVDFYDPATQTADVTPLIRRRERDPDNTEDVQNLPSINSVPVVFPRTGGFFISLPIQAGDTVLLLFCESDIEQWQFTGELSTPDDLRRHDLSDAVAIPGLFPEPQALQNHDAANEGMMIGSEAPGGARIYIKDDVIELGEKDAPQFVSVDAKIQNELDRLKGELDAVVTWMTGLDTAIAAGIAGVMGGDGGLAALTALQLSMSLNQKPLIVDPGDTASTLVTIKE